MPKVPRFLTNMNGIFAIEKPSGVSSSKLVGDLQHIFTHSKVFASDLQQAKDLVFKNLSQDKKWTPQRIAKKTNSLKVKVGHGGTLDPLASGVLIIGVGLGTKKLQHFLTECNKSYEARALLGISTTTGDSEGEIVSQSPVDHVTKELLEKTSQKFVGDLKQTPPIFSALKMDGKPLYEYAREGKPIPRDIKSRMVKVTNITVHEDSISYDHDFAKIESKLDDNGVPIEHALAKNPTLNDSPLFFSTQFLEDDKVDASEKQPNPINFLPEDQTLPEKLPMFHLSADVSSGTYIRSLLSDIGRALDSSAYMVELIRTRQSDWEVGKNTFKVSDFEDERVWGPVLKKVFDEGPTVDVESEIERARQNIETNENEQKTEQKEEKEEKDDDKDSKKRSIDDVEQ